MEAAVTEEIIARQPPEAQAIIRLLLARIAQLEARIKELERQVKGKTPQNSSLPPTAPQHLRLRYRRRRSPSRSSARSFIAFRGVNDYQWPQPRPPLPGRADVAPVGAGQPPPD